MNVALVLELINFPLNALDRGSEAIAFRGGPALFGSDLALDDIALLRQHCEHGAIDVVAVRGDDPHAARICRSLDRAICYGLSDEADYRATDIELRNFSSAFCVYRGKEKLGDAILNVPGEHNVRNALGVIALATELGVPFQKIAKSLTKFQHARRRFEIKYDSPRFLLVDDYGHHPTEIRATLTALRQRYQPRKLFCIFQPHQHSRTRFLLDDFASSFAAADETIVPDIYFVRDSETEKSRVSSADLVDRINRNGQRARHLRICRRRMKERAEKIRRFAV